jgi:hypothetical protein
MKSLAPMVLTAALAGTVALSSVGFAQVPPPPPHDKPGAPAPPGTPLPPAAINEWATKLQKIEDERRLARAKERKDAKAWEAAREAREAEHRRQLEAVWGQELLMRAECREELALHAERVARLDRIIDIAEDTNNGALLARARGVMAREMRRHARVMAELRARLGVR